VVAAAALAAAPAAAQGTGGTGLLLDLPPSARAVALGGAYAALVGDEGTMFVNPAALAAVRRLAVGFSQEEGLSGADLTTAAVAVRIGRFDLALGGMFLDLARDSGLIAPLPIPATGEGVTGYHALAVGAAAWRRGVLSFGVSVKGLREVADSARVEVRRLNGVTGDAGLAITFFDIAAFGVAVQNVAGRLSASDGTRPPLPRTTRAGLTLNIVDPQGPTRLLTVTEYVAPARGDAYWVLGVEGGVAWRGIGVVGRASYAAGRQPGDRSRAAYGAGILLRSLRFDWAAQPAEAAGPTVHRLGLRVVP
jgi:hypothetical protein